MSETAPPLGDFRRRVYQDYARTEFHPCFWSDDLPRRPKFGQLWPSSAKFRPTRLGTQLGRAWANCGPTWPNPNWPNSGPDMLNCGYFAPTSAWDFCFCHMVCMLLGRGGPRHVSSIFYLPPWMDHVCFVCTFDVPPFLGQCLLNDIATFVPTPRRRRPPSVPSPHQSRRTEPVDPFAADSEPGEASSQRVTFGSAQHGSVGTVRGDGCGRGAVWPPHLLGVRSKKAARNQRRRYGQLDGSTRRQKKTATPNAHDEEDSCQGVEIVRGWGSELEGGGRNVMHSGNARALRVLARSACAPSVSSLCACLECAPRGRACPICCECGPRGCAPCVGPLSRKHVL